MYEEGYGLVGVSSFVGAAQHEKGAIKQAKKVGAAVVLITSKYRNTETGALPITTPTTQTSYTSGTMNAFGTGGSAFGNYMGTTTTYGSQTTYVPYSVDKYEQAALYFAPLAHKGFGFMLDRPTDEQKRTTGTNQGLQVLAVRRGSPAFTADVLPGDVLLAIDGQGVADMDAVRSELARGAGREAELRLSRGGTQITKKVPLPADSAW
jgi:hypothetical protein